MFNDPSKWNAKDAVGKMRREEMLHTERCGSCYLYDAPPIGNWTILLLSSASASKVTKAEA